MSCSSSAAPSIGCPCGFSATTPCSSTAFGRTLGIPSSARQYSTSSSSSRPSPTAVDAVQSTITYAHGMFDDINDGKWMPLEYSSSHIPIKKVKLVGDKVDKEYSVLTEVGGKDLFASLILLIEKMDQHGYSFLHLTLSQLMIDKYGLFVIAEGAILQKSSKRVLSNAYFNCAAIFESIIRHTSGNSVKIPLEFRDLLKLLRKTRRTPHGYIMLSHPSLMPLHNQSQAFLDVYDYVMHILPDDMAKVVVEALRPSINFWDNILKGNELLQEWFKHKSGSRFDTKKPWDLFTYLRNVHSHSLSYQGTMRYTKDDVRLLVQCKFSRVMSTLYWKLWDQMVLPGIQTETYFCLPGGSCCPKPGFCLRRELRLLVKTEEVDKMMTAPRKIKKKETQES